MVIFHSYVKITRGYWPSIFQVNMFKEDGEVLHFASPKVQASVGANTYAPRRKTTIFVVDLSIKNEDLGLSENRVYIFPMK